MHFYIFSTFLVFLSIFLVSSNLLLIILKLYLNTGTANAPIDVILFLPFNSDFNIILNLLVYFFFNLCFICWCMTSFPSIPMYFYVFPCSSSCISPLKASIKFCKWTNFFSIYAKTLHTSQLQIPYGYHHWSDCFHLFLEFFRCFTSQLQIIPVNEMWYFDFCCMFLCSACSAVLWGGLS